MFFEIKGIHMKTQNKKLIKLSGILGILDSEKITESNLKTEDVTYTIGNEKIQYSHGF